MVLPEETWSAGGRLCCQRRSSSSSSAPLSKCSQKPGSPAMCMLCAMRLTACPQSPNHCKTNARYEGAIAKGRRDLRRCRRAAENPASLVSAAELAFTGYLESITSISRAPICSSDSIGKLNGEPASLASSPSRQPARRYLAASGESTKTRSNADQRTVDAAALVRIFLGPDEVPTAETWFLDNVSSIDL